MTIILFENEIHAISRHVTGVFLVTCALISLTIKSPRFRFYDQSTISKGENKAIGRNKKYMRIKLRRGTI